MLSRSSFALVSLAAVLLAGSLACSGPDKPMRIVLITLDTLRYDSFAGSDERPTSMPNLARWAQDATIFERFYTATSSTQPTHASMFTGLHPWQHGVASNGRTLADDQVTVAERLREIGFTTAATVASVPVGPQFGFAQGFERYDADFAPENVMSGWLHNAQRRKKAEQPEVVPEEGHYSLASVIGERALSQIETATGSRQFFWFHFFDPHSPYGDSAGGPIRRARGVLRRAQEGEEMPPIIEHARQLYDLDVAHLDEVLAQLLERLERDETFETHILIVADHGESFGEDDSMGHVWRLIPSQIHVPCLIRSPRLEPGVRSEVAGSVDVAATLLGFAGLEQPGTFGRDLARPSSGRPQALGMRDAFDRPQRDLRLDGKAYILKGQLFYRVNEHGELFRGNGDRLIAPEGGEQAPAEELSKQLRALFASFEEELAATAGERLDDPKLKRRLEALGYVG